MSNWFDNERLSCGCYWDEHPDLPCPRPIRRRPRSESGSENQGATVNSPSDHQARTLAVNKQTTKETTND